MQTTQYCVKTSVFQISDRQDLPVQRTILWIQITRQVGFQSLL